MKQVTKTTADLGLLSVTIFWGTTFILSKIVLAEISLSKYLAIRLTLAAFLMILIAARYRSEYRLSTFSQGFLLGIFLFLSYLFQMWGIQYTSASNAGFITGLSVVLVPIVAILFFGDHPKIASLVGVSFATAGLYFLSGGDFTALNIGDWLVFICAVVVTFHVIFTGKFARKQNVYLLTATQLATTALFSLIFTMIDGDPMPQMNLKITVLMIYLAVFGTVYTFLMQTAMQRFTTATRTALVFTMEPVFAALFAYLIGGELLSVMGWFGGTLILAGMLIAEIDWSKIAKKKQVGG